MLAARDAHLDDQLVRRERGLVVAGDQLLDRHLPLAAHAAGHGPRAEGDEHRRRVGGVVGVGEHAADRRLVAHARARDDRERVRQRRPPLAHDRRAARPRGASSSRRGGARRRPRCTSRPGTRRRLRNAAGASSRWLTRMPTNVPPATTVASVAPLGPQRERLVERGRDEPLRLGRQTATASLVQRLARARARAATRIRSNIQRCWSTPRSRLHRPLRRPSARRQVAVHLEERERVGGLEEILVLGRRRPRARASAARPPRTSSSAPSRGSQSPTIAAERSECSRRYSMSSSGAPLRSARPARPGSAARCRA